MELESMRRNITRVICNECRKSKDYLSPIINKVLKEAEGWVICGRRHFCDQACMDKYYEREHNGEDKHHPTRIGGKGVKSKKTGVVIIEKE